MVKLIKYVVFYKYSVNLNLMPATGSKSAGTGARLALCYIAFSLNNTQFPNKHLGTEEIVEALKVEFFSILASCTTSFAQQSVGSVVVF